MGEQEQDMKVQNRGMRKRYESPKWENQKQDANSGRSLPGDEGRGREKSGLEILEMVLELLGSNNK